MKKNTVSLVAALAVGGFLACTTIATAQDTNTAPRSGRRGASIEQRVDRMSTQLDLTPEQKTKVTALLQADAKQMREMRQDTSLSREDRRTKMREMRQESDKKLKAILTPEQNEKWQKLRQEMRSRRGQRGGGNGQ